MVVPPAPDGALTHSGRRWLVLGLVLVLVAALATIGWQVVQRATGPEDPQPTRERVMSLSEQFLLRINNYGPDMLDDSEQMPDYRESVRELLTPKFAADFDENVAIAEQTVVQAGVERSAEVYATGVSAIDEDSAEVLVAGRILQSLPSKDERVEADPIPFRMIVSVVRIDGEWLVDDYDPASRAGEPEEEQ